MGIRAWNREGPGEAYRLGPPWRQRLRARLSVLIGVHNPVVHGLFTLMAWRRLYGSLSREALVACITHDLGYWWCHDLDGDGESHPERSLPVSRWLARLVGADEAVVSYLVLTHSGSYCRGAGLEVGPLFYADKLSSALYPTWLWSLLAWFSGEATEYAARDKHGVPRRAPGLWGAVLVHRHYRPYALGILRRGRRHWAAYRRGGTR